jgi:Zn-dependent protease
MRTGVIRLFRFAGIDVYLHFTWFLVAAIFMTDYMRRYQSPIWGVVEYVSLFVIVLIHEFGHALACRQVGGVANRIVLWPLGGVAFVNPPRRPGAYLWSIAAGPLVNVALIPILAAAGNLVSQSENSFAPTDAYRFITDLRYINFWLLIFNMLPVFPLDGGQIVRGLLWFPFGEIRSLQISSVIGLIGGRIGVVGGVGVFPFKSRLVRLAAVQSDDRCVKNGNSSSDFAHCARRSDAAVGHWLPVIPCVVEGSRRVTSKVSWRDPSTPLGMTIGSDRSIVCGNLRGIEFHPKRSRPVSGSVRRDSSAQTLLVLRFGLDRRKM